MITLGHELQATTSLGKCGCRTKRWPKPRSRSPRILHHFMSLFEELFKEKEALKARVKQLENSLATHSSNRSKPPYSRFESDEILPLPPKTKSLRYSAPK